MEQYVIKGGNPLYGEVEIGGAKNAALAILAAAIMTDELSLDGVRNCTRYKEIEVDYLDQNFKPQHGKYSGWTAQIIQHEIDHCKGIII